MIELIKINNNDIKYLPFIIENGILYYFIIKKGIKVGIYCIMKITDEICEIALEIFEKSRYKVISRQTICFLIDFPFSLGFKKVITWTQMDSWIKLLNKFKYYGINRIENPSHDLDNEKIWFGKEIGFKNV